MCRPWVQVLVPKNERKEETEKRAGTLYLPGTHQRRSPGGVLSRQHREEPSPHACSLPCPTQDYLDNFWPDLKAAHELCDSILQSRRERESENQENHGREYAEHLPLEVLEAGIKSGRYVQVRGSEGIAAGTPGPRPERPGCTQHTGVGLSQLHSWRRFGRSSFYGS